MDVGKISRDGKIMLLAYDRDLSMGRQTLMKKMWIPTI